MDILDIEKSVQSAAPLPWRLRNEFSEQICADVPVAIETGGRPVVTHEEALLHGASYSTISQIQQDAQFLANSKMYVEILLRALVAACGDDRSKCSFLIAHAHKTVQQDCGLLPKEPPILHREV